jgi:hypothetical protein
MLSGRWQLAAAAAVRAASVEAATFRLSPRWVVAVISLLTVAAVAVSAVVLVLLIAVMAAASVAGLAAAATPSVVVFEAALVFVSVAATAEVLESVVEFLPFGRSATTGTETGSGAGFGTGSGSSPQLGGF